MKDTPQRLAIVQVNRFAPKVEPILADFIWTFSGFPELWLADSFPRSLQPEGSGSSGKNESKNNTGQPPPYFEIDLLTVFAVKVARIPQKTAIFHQSRHHESHTTNSSSGKGQELSDGLSKHAIQGPTDKKTLLVFPSDGTRESQQQIAYRILSVVMIASSRCQIYVACVQSNYCSNAIRMEKPALPLNLDLSAVEADRSKSEDSLKLNVVRETLETYLPLSQSKRITILHCLPNHFKEFNSILILDTPSFRSYGLHEVKPTPRFRTNDFEVLRKKIQSIDNEHHRITICSLASENSIERQEYLSFLSTLEARQFEACQINLPIGRRDSSGISFEPETCDWGPGHISVYQRR